MISKKYLVLVMAVVLMTSVAQPVEHISAQRKEIKITKTTFPDAMFRDFIHRKVDKDKNGKLSWSERKSVIKIKDASGYRNVFRGTMSERKEKHSLEGIKYFPELRQVNIQNVCVSKIDFSQNPKLEKVHLYATKTVHINLRKNKNLVKFYCMQGAEESRKYVLKKFDFTNNTKLKSLDIEIVPETRKLDFSTLTYLERLNIAILCGYKGNIKQLDLSNNRKLKDICCPYLGLEKLDLSNCLDIEYIQCRKNKLKELKLPSGATLKFLNCYGNNIKQLDLSGVKFSNENDYYESRRLIKDKKTTIIREISKE